MGRKFVEPKQYALRLHPDLWNELVRRADSDGVPVNDLIATLVAKGLGCPDLAGVPKKQAGRRPALAKAGR